MDTGIFFEIAKYLPIKDIVSLCLTRKTYGNSYNEIWLWKYLSNRDFCPNNSPYANVYLNAGWNKCPHISYIEKYKVRYFT